MKFDLQNLENIRTNIINWYPFEKESTILEIGNNCEEITKFLETKCKKVISIENIEKEINEEFDYCLINNAEERKETFQELLKYANAKMKQTGTILLTIDNKLGLQNLNASIEYQKQKQTKSKIEKYAKQTKFKNIKFYYPLPNYKLTNVIFTDKHTPSSESLQRDLTLYDNEKIIVFDERKTFIDIVEEEPKLFKYFANSYLVEISNKPDNEIEFISFGNSRKEKYRMKTIMKKDIVEKYPISEKETAHLERIKKNIEILKKLGLNVLDESKEDHIESKIVREVKTFDKILAEYAKEAEDKKLIEGIKIFEKELNDRLEKSTDTKETIFEKYNVEITKEQKVKLTFKKHGIYDLIFQNAFYIDGKFYFYDQEWIEENIPIEFIIYRALKYMANSSKYIDVEKICKELGIKEYIGVFNELENILQKNILDEEIWKIHVENGIKVENLKDTCTHYKNLRDIEENKRLQQINELNTIIKTREEEIMYMKNSMSWKITKPLRKIYEKTRKERNKQ